MDKFFTVFGLVLIPIAIGVAFRHRFPELAGRLQKPVRIIALVLLVVAVLGAVAGGRTTLWHHFGALSGAVVTFCAVSLTVGYLAPRLMRLAPRQAVAVSLEVGMHNAVVAMGVALSPQLLNSAEMAMPAALYSAVAPLLAVSFVFLARRVDPPFAPSPRGSHRLVAPSRWCRAPARAGCAGRPTPPGGQQARIATAGRRPG